jgi:hypothetical protein
MKAYLVITIDVEPDSSFNWQYSDPLRFKGVSEGIAKRLQPLFNKFEITPTYLVNNIVLEASESVGILKKLPGKFELGTHLHPEFIEPDKKYDVYAGKRGKENCCFYPPAVEFAKIENITILFEKVFGYKPTSFRAGRFSAGANTINSLIELGYLVDTSVTPHICWDDATREKPVDFRDAPEQPYFVGRDSITKENSGGKLLETPVSIALKKRNIIREWVVGVGSLRHPIRKYRPVWLRPYYSTADEMINIALQYVQAYRHRELVILNMMFHNVEVLPNLSPYTRTEDDCERYLNNLDHFFSFCKQNNFISVGVSDLYDICKVK